jgi:hypothetical protein
MDYEGFNKKCWVIPTDRPNRSPEIELSNPDSKATYSNIKTNDDQKPFFASRYATIGSQSFPARDFKLRNVRISNFQLDQRSSPSHC